MRIHSSVGARRLAIVVAAIALLGAGYAQSAELIQLTPGRKHLFLDDYVVQKISSLRRTMHRPHKKGAVLKPDTPSDGYLVQIRSAPVWVEDERVYKMIYLAYHDPYSPVILANQPGQAYAVSKDGLHWQKPSLNKRNIRGSSDNNRIAVAPPSATWPTNAMESLVYDPFDRDPTRRYKGLRGAEYRQPVISANCLEWKKLPVPQITSGDEAQLVFDQKKRQFLATVKSYDPYGRAVSLALSSDFDHWTPTRPIFAADAEDRKTARAVINARLADEKYARPQFVDPDPGEGYVPKAGGLVTWTCDVYNMAVFPYEGIYIGMPAFFYRTGMDAKGTNNDGFHHIQLTTSRDMYHWRRLGGRKPFIGPSPVGSRIGVFDRMQLLPGSRPVRRGDELWFYYSGLKWRDCPWLYNRDGKRRPKKDLSPAERADLADGVGAVCLAVLRLDGFISLDADNSGGYVQTKPMRIAGKNLFINVNASGGKAMVEILDSDGKTIPGYSAADCIAVTSDNVRAPVAWKRHKDCTALAGKTVILAIYLTNASLYSFGVD